MTSARAASRRGCHGRSSHVYIAWVLAGTLSTLSLLPARAADGAGARVDGVTSALREDTRSRDDVRATSAVRVGVRVFALEDDEHPAVSRAWFHERLGHANRLFDVIGVRFEVASWESLRVANAPVDTRAQRDALGAAMNHEGQVDVYLVPRLTDVDAPPAQIRGVHWRLRRDTSRRWIIMSAISGPMVLAHELGHFFSLPHGAEPTSIMNKRPRRNPPWEQRVFTPREQTAMVTALKRMLDSGRLTPREAR